MNTWKASLDNSMALFEVAFLQRVWNWSRKIFKIHSNFVGSAEQWIMVLVDLESNKTLRSFFDGWAQVILQVEMVQDSNFGLSLADTCCTGRDA